MAATVRIRRVEEADVSPCVDLCIAAYTNHFFKLLEERYGLLGDRSWEERERSNLTTTFTHNMDRMFVATLSDEVVGYILYYYTRVLGGRIGIGYLSNNAVTPRLQGMGIGKLLGHKVLESFRQLQLQYARTTTSSQTCQAPARNVYQRLGYTICRESLDWTMDLRKSPIQACKPEGVGSIAIRQATPDDLGRILSLGITYFDGISLYAQWRPHGLDPDLAWQGIQRELVGEAMRHRIENTLVTLVKGEVIGYIAFEIDEQAGIGTTNVIRGQGEDMAVNNAIAPCYRGTGLEAYQLAHVLQMFKEKGMAVGITRGLDANARTRLGLRLDYNAWGFTPLRGYVDLFMRIV